MDVCVSDFPVFLVFAHVFFLVLLQVDSGRTWFYCGFCVISVIKID